MSPDLEALAARLRTEGTVMIPIKVVPKSARNEIAGWMPDGSLKVKVAAAPEKGKANAELRAFLAKEFGAPQGNVEIVRGGTSPHKQVRITR